MKEIIEKWAKSYMRNECVTEDQIQEAQEDLSNIIYGLAWHEKDKQEAMEKQPTEYEYEQIDFEESVFCLADDLRNGDLYDSSQSLIENDTQLCELFPVKDIYRRIELTPEQLHERKVEEFNLKFQEVFLCQHNHSNISANTSIAIKRMAELAVLEWMESKGK